MRVERSEGLQLPPSHFHCLPVHGAGRRWRTTEMRSRRACSRRSSTARSSSTRSPARSRTRRSPASPRTVRAHPGSAPSRPASLAKASRPRGRGRAGDWSRRVTKEQWGTWDQRVGRGCGGPRARLRLPTLSAQATSSSSARAGAGSSASASSAVLSPQLCVSICAETRGVRSPGSSARGARPLRSRSPCTSSAPPHSVSTSSRVSCAGGALRDHGPMRGLGGESCGAADGGGAGD